MKHRHSSFLLYLLVFFALAVVYGTDEAAKPDYKALIHAMFDKAVVCKVEGYVMCDKLQTIHYSTPDARSLQKLKEMLLSAKMIYAVNQHALGAGQNYSDYLHLSWFDAQGKKLNVLAIADGDTLIFNGAVVFYEPWKEGDGPPLEVRVADFAVPGIYGDLKAPRSGSGAKGR